MYSGKSGVVLGEPLMLAIGTCAPGAAEMFYRGSVVESSGRPFMHDLNPLPNCGIYQPCTLSGWRTELLCVLLRVTELERASAVVEIDGWDFPFHLRSSMYRDQIRPGPLPAVSCDALSATGSAWQEGMG